MIAELALLEELTGLLAKLTSLVIALGISIPLIKHAFRRWNQRAMNVGQRLLQEQYTRLEKIRDQYGADRIIVFRGHNCGGIPVSGKPFFVTSVRWVARTVKGEKIEDYSQLQVDAAYIAMLNKARVDGMYHFDVGKEADCQLRSYYLRVGVTHSYIYHIRTESRAYVFMSVATFGEPFSENALTGIRLEVEALKNLKI